MYSHGHGEAQINQMNVEMLPLVFLKLVYLKFEWQNNRFIKTLNKWVIPENTMYPYPRMGGMNILTPRRLWKFQNAQTPMPPEF